MPKRRPQKKVDLDTLKECFDSYENVVDTLNFLMKHVTDTLTAATDVKVAFEMYVKDLEHNA